MRNPNERLVMCNFVGVDKGALTMVKNVLERANKNEVKNALVDSAVPVEVVLEQMAKDFPALYMKFVTEQMMILYA